MHIYPLFFFVNFCLLFAARYVKYTNWPDKLMSTMCIKHELIFYC